jgi:hypothetical protein
MTNELFMTKKAEMLQELLRTRMERNTIGIWASHLGTGMFLCSVKEVCTDEDEDDIMIILKETEFASPRVNTHVVYLHEIERIYTFKGDRTESDMNERMASRPLGIALD